MAGKRVPIEERFWAKVQKGPRCWEWTGAKNRDTGYGVLGSGGARGTIGAHRLSYTLAYGAIPDGLFICHHCDNRGCVRPDHLFLGTPADNNRDMQAKGRYARPNARLGAGDVLEILGLIKDGITQEVIAEKFGICRTNVSAIATGRSWNAYSRKAA